MLNDYEDNETRVLIRKKHLAKFGIRINGDESPVKGVVNIPVKTMAVYHSQHSQHPVLVTLDNGKEISMECGKIIIAQIRNEHHKDHCFVTYNAKQYITHENPRTLCSLKRERAKRKITLYPFGGGKSVEVGIQDKALRINSMPKPENWRMQLS